MSLEEEVAELSLAYHGYREENEELRRLLWDYYETIGNMPMYATAQDYERLLQPLQARTKALLDEHPPE